ncbi:MAG: DUF1684 domain-containing protein [Micromonosporaceae bacterium]
MSLDVLDWRRTVFELYRQVRAGPDPERAWQLWRDGRDELVGRHPASPLPPTARERFTGLRYAPYDPAKRYELLPVEPAEPARIEVPTATDGVVPFERVGQLRLPELGTLDVWWLDSYGGGIFVPLRDASGRHPDLGQRSYGGGRYLIDTVKGADLGGTGDRLTVDLNFAYNPSCAYDAAWQCPLAPPGNVLTAPVYAGELTWHAPD